MILVTTAGKVRRQHPGVLMIAVGVAPRPRASHGAIFYVRLASYTTSQERKRR
jgi:hypothetical protein